MFGVAVYLASRVTSHAHGGEILLTAAARDQSTLGEGTFTDFGPTHLPGFDDPVHLFECPWRGDPETTPGF
jgi:class 3 adenylate cyclase